MGLNDFILKEGGEIMQLASSIITVISFVFIILKVYTNNNYCLVVEDKFSIPKEYVALNFENIFIDTASYILMIIGLTIIIMFIENNTNYLPKHIIIPMLFVSVFMFNLGTMGIIFDKFNIRNKMNICCGLAIYLICPVLIVIFLVLIKFSNLIIAIMKIFAAICIILYLRDDLDFDSKKYEIVKINGKYYALFVKSDKECFILIEVKKIKGITYSVVKKGKYKFMKNVNKKNIVKGKIE